MMKARAVKGRKRKQEEESSAGGNRRGWKGEKKKKKSGLWERERSDLSDGALPRQKENWEVPGTGRL
jgi:hypothetical protein